MAIAQLAAGLWRRSRPFRTLVYGGVIVSVLTIVSGQLGGGSGSTAPSGVSQQATNTTSQQGGQNLQSQAPAPQNPSAQKLVQCGPQGGTRLQAPLVVTQNNQVPSNVKSVGGGSQGIPLDVQSRITQFMIQVNAARSEQRMGEQCARMAGATDLLEQLDYAYVDCFSDGSDRLQRAATCEQSHDASEKRYERFLAAHASAERDQSAEKIVELATARSQLVPYDEQRERWKEHSGELGKGALAVTEISESDARIARLENAARSAAKYPDLSNVPAILSLSNAADLRQIDVARLNEVQQKMFEAAELASKEVVDSKARLVALQDAMQQLGSANADERAALIAAVSALTDFDQARATPEEIQSINSARSEAAGFAIDDLIIAANRFTTGAPPAVYERLTELADVVNLYGGIQTPTEEQSSALETAMQAEQFIARSDRRLKNIQETQAAVAQSGPGTMGERVDQVLTSVTDFDKARMGSEVVKAFAALEAAQEVARATKERNLTRSVPIFVKTSGTDALSLEMVDEFSTRLGENGFQIVLAEEQAAVSLELILGKLNVKTPSGFPRSADITMSLLGKWNLADDSIPRLKAKGVGYRDEAETQATGNALDGLMSDFIELVKD